MPTVSIYRRIKLRTLFSPFCFFARGGSGFCWPLPSLTYNELLAKPTFLVSLFIRLCSVPLSIMYVCIFLWFNFFLLTSNFQNSGQNSFKQNENFLVSCDQLRDTFRAAPTPLSMVSMTRRSMVWFASVKALTLCGLMSWFVARQLSFVKCLR